ncbi:alcohol dehydrogenase, putative, partial [Perkinsus marinus ATCC 50983]
MQTIEENFELSNVHTCCSIHLNMANVIEGESVTDRPALPREMEAFYYTGFGGPEVCEVGKLPLPGPPGPHQLLVKVHYASLNPADYQQRNGETKHLLKHKFPKVFGFDFSGDVMEIGDEVKDFKIGEE